MKKNGRIAVLLLAVLVAMSALCLPTYAAGINKKTSVFHRQNFR